MSLIVDARVHAGIVGEHFSPFTPEHARLSLRRARRRRGERGGDLVAEMDRAGIDVICLMAGGYNRALPPDARPNEVSNDYTAQLVAQHPDRVVGTCNVDPVADPYAAAQEVERCATRHGFRALKLYPTYQRYDPREERVFPVYSECIELDIPVQMHMGRTAVTSARMEFQYPRLLDDVGRRFPELKLVVARMAYPWVEECTCLLELHKNSYSDILILGMVPPVQDPPDDGRFRLPLLLREDALWIGEPFLPHVPLHHPIPERRRGSLWPAVHPRERPQ